MSILITLCARGGSKGLPKKNIKSLNGQPLLHYSIELARQFSENQPDSIIELSTDDPSILSCAKDAKLQTDYLRPNELGSDTAGKIPVIKDLFCYAEEKYQLLFDYIIDLDVSSPLRTLNDLENAFEQLKQHETALNIFSVSKSRKNPYFNMVEKENTGDFVRLVKDRGEILGRQRAPEVFEMNASFYIYRREFFIGGNNSAITERSLAFTMNHTCFDIDSPEDFKIMEIMLKEGMINFDFGQK